MQFMRFVRSALALMPALALALAAGSLCIGRGALAQSLSVQPPDLKALFQASQFEQLDQQLAPALLQVHQDLGTHRRLARALDALAEIKPPPFELHDAWVAATGSAAAHLARANFHESRAWAARGTGYANTVHADGWARMNALMAIALADFQQALAKAGPQCDPCWAGQIRVRMVQGDRDKGAQLLDEALKHLQGGIATPHAYLTYLDPKWRGSVRHQEEFVERLANDYPGAAGLPLMRSVLLVDRSWAETGRGRHAQALLLAQQAAQVEPGNALAWARVASVALELDQHALVLSASEASLALYPQATQALTARASVLLRGVAPLDAVPVLERAVALGDTWALQTLLPILAAGKHGFKPDRERAERVCQSAIAALMPTGFACMGGLHYFGLGRAADKPQALQFFIQAGERGVAVAMADAGLMLLRGDGVPANREQGVLWLRRAHEAGDARAQPQLRANLSGVEYLLRVDLAGLERGFEASLGPLAAYRDAVFVGVVVLMGACMGGAAYYGRRLQRRALRSGPRAELRAGWPVCALALLNLVFTGALLLILGYFATHTLPWLVLLAAALFAAAACIAYRTLFVRIQFNADGLRQLSMLGGKQAIRFRQIQAMGWSWWSLAFVVTSTQGKRIHIHLWLSGWPELVDRLERQQGRFAPTMPTLASTTVW